MKLYYSPFACSLAPHMALYEAGFHFDALAVDLKTKRYEGGDFLKVHPRGYVPLLVLDNGQQLTETGVILQYIADLKPEISLIPRPGTMERYRCQEWISYIATELHKGFAPLWNEATPTEYKEIVKTNLYKKMEFLSSALKQQKFLMGNQYTVADAYLFTVLSWAPHVDVDISKWPVLLGYVEAVKSRPATLLAIRAEKIKTPS